MALTPTSFKKGHAKVGGRKANPLLRTAQELARQYTDIAIERLAEIVRGEDAKAACTAAGILLNRAWGLPAQTITATVASTVRVENAASLDSKLESVLAARTIGEAQKPTVQ